MRWKTRPIPSPKTGDTRIKYKMAWKPTKVQEHTVWLEFFGIEERFFQPPGELGVWSEITRWLATYV